MLQSVLSPIPTFAMSAFELHVGVCKQIQSELTRFWWDSPDGKKKICWKAWDQLTLPKQLEGLGFRDIQLFNQALLGKIAWRLITKPDCLLAKVLLGKYCHKTPFLKATQPQSFSHSWKGILHGRDLLLTHLGKTIGDGEDTKVWTDSWIHPKLDVKVFRPTLERDQDLMVADLLSRETKEWNKAKVDNLLPELSSLILSIHPSKKGVLDTYIWTQQESGVYTAKSGYFTARMDKIQSTSPLLNLERWNWQKFV
ncbi:uncharacterized mitochondrial protein AtMg00310-like [Raphanus sativus]|uniref:Uncharacterized mitochondrial protein AtMg00310-like n=1 Tax=Raphanus sativus TaxID=3726 RepID=A0A6J0MNY6_RAPSA|nr:uncharacterized mitochondrial protein AtMg00310-like [Raphanus sativus]